MNINREQFSAYFSWIGITIGDVEHKLKFTLGSFLFLKNKYNIDINGDNVDSVDVETLCKFIQAGLPKEYREKTSIEDIAEQIDFDQLMEAQEGINNLIQDSMPEKNDDSKKKPVPVELQEASTT